MTKHKGYFVYANPDKEWGDHVHGKNATQAKSMMWKAWSWEIDDWIDMMPYRDKSIDDVPITFETMAQRFGDMEGWQPICSCELCKNTMEKK